MPRHTPLGIDIDRSYASMVRKLMDDDSGAAIALIDLLSRGRRIGAPVSDDSAWCLTMLDSFGICGANLYVFWSRVCDHSTEQMVTLLRACHEGCNGVSQYTIMQAIDCCNRTTLQTELQPVS
jgi:hypothetical protein